MKRNNLFLIATAVIAAALGLWGFLALHGSVVSADRGLLSALPGRPALLLQVNRPDDFRRQMLYNNTYWSRWTESGLRTPAGELLLTLDSLCEQDPDLYARLAGRTWMVAWYLTGNKGNESFRPLICTQSSQDDQHAFTAPLARLDGFFFCQADGVTALCTDSLLLDACRKELSSASSELTADSLLTRLTATVNVRAAANLMADRGQLKHLMQPYWREGKRPDTGDDTGWVALDWEGGGKCWTLSGFSARQTSSLAASEWDAARFLPRSVYWFRSLAVDSTLTLPAETAEWTSPSGDSPRLLLQECSRGGYAVGECPEGRVALMGLKDGETARTRLKSLTESLGGTWNDGVSHFASSGWAGHLLGARFTFADEYTAIRGNTLYIASSAGLLKKTLESAERGECLKHSDDYRVAESDLQTRRSETFYANLHYFISHASEFWTDEFTSRHADWLRRAGAFQVLCAQTDREAYGLDYKHVSLRQTRDRSSVPPQVADASVLSENSPSAEASARPANTPRRHSVTLDAPLAITPAWFTNHHTGATEVIVQDTRNQLYLIALPENGENAEILWKASLKERITGEIHTLDLLNNGKLQMAFTTSSRLYVIDRTGHNVKGFPLSLKGKTLSGLAVADYDGDKNYRLFVGLTDGRVLLFRKDGTRPADWGYKPTGQSVTAPVQHFRADGKDYLTIQSGNTLAVVDRRGRIRVRPASPMPCSGNPVYLENTAGARRFLTSGPDGTPQYMGTDGKRLSAALDRSYRPGHTFLQNDSLLLLADSDGIDLYNRDGDPMQSGMGKPQGKVQLADSRVAYTEDGMLHLKAARDGSEAHGFPVQAEEHFLYTEKGAVYGNKNTVNVILF